MYLSATSTAQGIRMGLVLTEGRAVQARALRHIFCATFSEPDIHQYSPIYTRLVSDCRRLKRVIDGLAVRLTMASTN